MAAPLILNVDDYAPGRYARSKMLRLAGFTVLEATSGSEALAMLKNKPDVVLLDINLPDLNGLEVCRRIKGDPATESIVVLHVSATCIRDADMIAGLNNGADSYLTEPVQPELLAATIRALLRARKAEDALRVSNQDLRELTHLLSHDMREPLRAMSIYTHLLEQSVAARLTPVERQYLDFTVSGARQMSELIEGVLLFSRTLHEGLEAADIAAGDAVQAACAELDLLLRESQARVEVGPMPKVKANLSALTRVFANLLSNSIKYSGGAVPDISISAEAAGEFWTFTVRDNGIGIDPKYHLLIFEPFKRLHGRDVSGVGIGLSLCRRIIDAHGGHIWVESQPGQGAAFRFTLPVAQEAALGVPGRVANSA